MQNNVSTAFSNNILMRHEFISTVDQASSNKIMVSTHLCRQICMTIIVSFMKSMNFPPLPFTKHKKLNVLNFKFDHKLFLEICKRGSLVKSIIEQSTSLKETTKQKVRNTSTRGQWTTGWSCLWQALRWTICTNFSSPVGLWLSPKWVYIGEICQGTKKQPPVLIFLVLGS